MKKVKFLFFLVFGALLLGLTIASCNKDVTDINSPSVTESKAVTLYELDYLWSNLEIDWAKSKILYETPKFIIYSFPVLNETIFNNGNSKQAYLLFKENKIDKSVSQLLQVLERDVEFRSNNGSDSFSGIIYQVLPSGRFLNQYVVNAGQVESKFRGVTTKTEIKTELAPYWVDPWGEDPLLLDFWGDGDDKMGTDNYADADCSEIIPCGGECPNGKPKDLCCHTWETCNDDLPDPCDEICPDCFCESYGSGNITVECDCSAATAGTQIFSVVIPIDDNNSGSGGGTNQNTDWSTLINNLLATNENPPCEDSNDNPFEIDSELLDIGFESLDNASDILALPANVLIEMYGGSSPQFIINAIEKTIAGEYPTVLEAMHQISSTSIANTNYNPTNHLHTATYIVFLQLVNSINNCIPMSMEIFLENFDNYLGENYINQEQIKNQIASNLNISIDQVASFAESCSGSGDVYENCILEEMGLAGQDWYYDEDFWEQPNLTFPHQDLPSWQDFYDGFPKKNNGEWVYGADNIYSLAGGDVEQVRLNDVYGHTNNTCALKVSIALNNAGIIIPSIITSTDANGTTHFGTVQGGDGKYYFLNAKSLNRFLEITFGTDNPDNLCNNYSHLSTSECYSLTDKGILISTVNGSISGHADLYDGSNCSTQHCLCDGENNFWKLD